MKNLRSNLKLVIILVLLLGLVVTVVLVQTQKTFKGKAAAEINAALEVTDSEGNPLEYQGNGVYKTNSLNVRVGIKDLEQLK